MVPGTGNIRRYNDYGGSFFYHLTQGGRSSGVTQTGRHGIVYGKGGMVPRHKDGTNPLLRKRQRGLAFSVGNMNGLFSHRMSSFL